MFDDWKLPGERVLINEEPGTKTEERMSFCPERFAGHDRLDQVSQTEFIFDEAPGERFDRVFVGELKGATQRICQKFRHQCTGKLLFALFEQVVPELGNTVDFMPVRQRAAPGRR